MRPEYDGVKFYSTNDWSIEKNLEKSAIILESFDHNEDYTNINRVIELYNVQELINSGTYLRTWDEEKIEHYKKLCISFTKVLGKFFGKINDENFQQVTHSVCIGYVNDYWRLFVKFKVFNRVSGKVFAEYINDSETVLRRLLQQEELIKYYGKELADVMRISQQSPRLIIDKFLRRHERKCIYHFPKELLPSEYEGILHNYISLDTANLNDLQLLAYAQSSKECPISDKLRLCAKRACESYLEKWRFTGVQIDYEISMEFTDVPEIMCAKKLENNVYKFAYDVKWLLDNLDYPTILNNFRYIFEQFDSCWRSRLVSVRSQLGIIEETLFVRGIKDYVKGNGFNAIDILSTMQIRGYYDLLKRKNVRLEDVLKWFFEEYLMQEFGANGFRFNPPSEGTTLVEKCRTIASEMDGILKQFRMYVQDGEIDRELFEMSSEHIVFSNLSGFVKDKYAYENSSDIQNEQFLLFSEQSHLCYIEKTKNNYTCIWDLLIQEDIMFSDFEEYQQGDIEWLIEKDIVIKNSDGYLKLNGSKAFILKDLYDHDVICPQYYDNELKNIIDEWCKNGDLRLEASLFSKPEQDYLNYELNKSSYSNGLDLRNKYTHSTYPENEKTQFADYIRLLRIMILVITKINEEFCLREQINEICKEGKIHNKKGS